jgi:hypothetical protein
LPALLLALAAQFCLNAEVQPDTVKRTVPRRFVSQTGDNFLNGVGRQGTDSARALHLLVTVNDSQLAV